MTTRLLSFSFSLVFACAACWVPPEPNPPPAAVSTGTTGVTTGQSFSSSASTGTTGSACLAWGAACSQNSQCCDGDCSGGACGIRDTSSSTMTSVSVSSTGTVGNTGSNCQFVGATGTSAGATGGSSGTPGCSLENATTCSDEKVQCSGTACVCSGGGQTMAMVSTAQAADCASAQVLCFGTNGASDTTGTNGTSSSCTNGCCSTGCAGSTTGTSGTNGQGGTSTPLVFVFDAAPVTYTDAANQFEITRPGSGLTSDWPAARTPWLALDRNGNGSIDDGRELFGSMTLLPSGRLAHDGFEALAALDSNHDGVLDARDAAFTQLRLWADRDQDRRTGPGELTALSARHVESISLDYGSDARCDRRGNCEIERAPFTWRDDHGALRTGEVVDIHLATRSMSVASR